MSDEVTNFLRSVEQLKGKREEEDEARSRELEEKILQERKERQARRAERARSISPQKSSPAQTPSPTSQRVNVSALASDGISLTSSPAFDGSASPRSRTIHTSDAMASSPEYSTSPTKENDSPFDSDAKRTSYTLTSPSTGVPPARSPLSWQRRPTSQASERPKSRPLSMVAAENAAARSTPNPSEPPSSTEQAFSRDQIAHALSSKDPSWFRQTADRGQNSAAYRRSQVEDEDRLDMASMRAQLPGMSRDISASETGKEAAAPRSSSPPPRGKLASPLVLTSAQRLDPPTGDGSGEEAPTVGSGRTSPTRPVSPTKGLGGFVQSAMMKRSDSVNKRWSVTSPTGLQRADSVATNRNSHDKSERAQAGSRLSSTLRDGSTTPSSRPTSSHDKAPDAQEVPAADSPEDPEDTTPPTSPSKTMDPRRWSPTKSSWLEAALNKPESPKPKPTPPVSQQPAWMVELNKAKAQKPTGSEPTRGPTVSRKHEVKTGGLMRSSPPGTNVKPAALSGAGALFPPPAGAADKAPVGGFRSNLSKATPKANAGTGEAGDGSDTGASSKAKPETPPKKDFRANLKSRQPPGTSAKDDSNELQNVFGNLKKTKTQNYVAPDELKNNILRGKAALNVTGGPKPSEKRDEFKEAILKKKEEFKRAQLEGKGVTRTLTSASEKPTPEALAKKMEMSRPSTTSSKRDSGTSDAAAEPPRRSTDSNRSSAYSLASKRDSREDARAGRTVSPTEREPIPSLPALQKETSAPGRMQSKPGGNALADRFNPALAGLLARGPPGMGSSAGRSSDESAGRSGLATAVSGEPSAPGPQLTHMTKNRARGPRRKAPTSASKSVDGADDSVVEPIPSIFPNANAGTAFEEPSKPVPVAQKQKPTPAPKTFSTVDSSRKNLGEERPASVGNVIPLVDSSRKPPVEGRTISTGQPISFVTSPKAMSSSTFAPPSPKKVQDRGTTASATGPRAAYVLDEEEEERAQSQPSSPKKLDVKRMSQFLNEQNTKAEPEKTRPPSPQKSRPLPDIVPSSPKKAPVNDNVDSDPVVSVKNATALFGSLSSNADQQYGSKQKPEAESAKRDIQRPRSPTKLTSRPLPVPIASAAASTPLASPMRSPTKYALEISALLTEFFGPERPRRSYNVDAGEALERRPTPARIRTQKAQLFQFSGDGKKQPVPAHYERVLFEREMYLCTHTFLNEVGKKVAEVYFWAGDEVPESTVEDAHVFVQREARAYGGKLIKITQGKETAEFLQALGGIVLVRRGSSNKYDSLAPNMLCGRRYMGQVAFDEVDFSPASLCSGFPYLITQQGKCYLWKGKGSDVDELSCARLIGMDLALMGELQEVEDGNEPAGFWDIFDGSSRPHSADHWRLKPNYDKYCARLFCSDAADRKQIIELSPFNQVDLLPSNVYVLDAFFELYILVGARAQHQYASFHNALDFAQEYAILAAGAEDRPFVPVSTVVLEGVPRDLRSVFRKWRDGIGPTAEGAAKPRGQSPDLRRGRSLRIVPLTQALQALT